MMMCGMITGARMQANTTPLPPHRTPGHDEGGRHPEQHREPGPEVRATTKERIIAPT